MFENESCTYLLNKFCKIIQFSEYHNRLKVNKKSFHNPQMYVYFIFLFFTRKSEIGVHLVKGPNFRTQGRR